MASVSSRIHCSILKVRKRTVAIDDCTYNPIGIGEVEKASEVRYGVARLKSKKARSYLYSSPSFHSYAFGSEVSMIKGKN